MGREKLEKLAMDKVLDNGKGDQISVARLRKLVLKSHICVLKYDILRF